MNKLKIEPRKVHAKGAISQMRREGCIPGIIYTPGSDSTPVTIRLDEFQAILRGIKAGRLPTTVFELEFTGRHIKALVKEIQYHPVSYAILHIDLEALEADKPVNVKIPVTFSGVAECPGIKLGGNLRQVIRHLRVRCLPKKIPEQFVIDVSALNMYDTKRVRDIAMPEGIKSLISENEVVVTIAKR